MADEGWVKSRGSPAFRGDDKSGGRVIELDPQTDARWVAFVAAQRDGLIYHHPRWLRVIEEAYGHEPLCLACESSDGRLQGVLPLFRTRGLLTGRCLSSLPHTPVAGPLACDERSTAALVRASLEWVQREPPTRLILKLPGSGLEGLVEGVVGSPWEETYVLQLPEPPEELRFGNSRNHARVRWAVNKATKSGLRVREAETRAELRQWYGLYLEAMRSHAVPPRPYKFFRIAWDLLQPAGLMRLLLAEQHDQGQRRLLAGSIFLMFGQTVFYAFNGRHRDDLGLRPNDLIQWQAIQGAWCNGFRRYDFGEVTVEQQGLAQFKSKWGAEPRRMVRYGYPALRGPGALPGERFLRKAWRRLPLWATALAGDWIYGYLVG